MLPVRTHSYRVLLKVALESKMRNEVVATRFDDTTFSTQQMTRNGFFGIKFFEERKDNSKK